MSVPTHEESSKKKRKSASVFLRENISASLEVQWKRIFAFILAPHNESTVVTLDCTWAVNTETWSEET